MLCNMEVMVGGLLVVQTVNLWAWHSLQGVYTMIQDWAPMPPLESLQLLLPTYVLSISPICHSVSSLSLCPHYVTVSPICH